MTEYEIFKTHMDTRKYMFSDDRWWHEAFDGFNLTKEEIEESIKFYEDEGGPGDNLGLIKLYKDRLKLCENKYFIEHCKRVILNRKLKKLKRC